MILIIFETIKYIKNILPFQIKVIFCGNCFASDFLISNYDLLIILNKIIFGIKVISQKKKFNSNIFELKVISRSNDF